MIPSLLALCLGLPALTLAARQPKDAIKLSDVKSLTLRGKGAMTNHRRVSAIPQLRCVSRGAICDLYEIDVMRCTNQGSSWGDEDIEWSCTASLPEELKLGSTDVICEGYAYPDDPYVLKGSCGVEYQLALTSKGERRYPDIANGGWFNDGRGGIDWGALVFTIIFVSILGWIIYSACCVAQRNNANNNRPRRRPDGWGGPGGWGPGWGPGGGDDPPPPYPGTKPQNTDSWRPGFWSGAAGGAAAGYWAGSRNSNNNNHCHHDSNSNYGSIGRGGGGWNWGGSGSSSGSNNSNRHESTGFGSTSRR